MQSVTITEGWEEDIIQLMLRIMVNGLNSMTVQSDNVMKAVFAVQVHTYCSTRGKIEVK